MMKMKDENTVGNEEKMVVAKETMSKENKLSFAQMIVGTFCW